MKKGQLRCSTITFPKNFKSSGKWVPMTWKPAPQIVKSEAGADVYAAHGSIYYLSDSRGNNERDIYCVLNGTSWSSLPVDGHTDEMHGSYVWTDGKTLYCSYSTYNQRVLDGNTWKEKAWEEIIDGNTSKVTIWGDNVWSDGVNIHHSMGRTFSVLKNGVWEPHTWDNDDVVIYGRYIWSDGVNIYLSYSGSNLVLNGNMWETKAWDGFAPRHGEHVWSDGQRVYYSANDYNEKVQYVLENGVWVPMTWEGLDSGFNGNEVWSDGTNIYLNFDYVLEPAPGPTINPSNLMQGFTTMLSLRRNRT